MSHIKTIQFLDINLKFNSIFMINPNMRELFERKKDKSPDKNKHIIL